MRIDLKWWSRSCISHWICEKIRKKYHICCISILLSATFITMHNNFLANIVWFTMQFQRCVFNTFYWDDHFFYSINILFYNLILNRYTKKIISLKRTTSQSFLYWLSGIYCCTYAHLHAEVFFRKKFVVSIQLFSYGDK